VASSALSIVSPNSCLLFPTPSSPDSSSIAPCVGSRYGPLATPFYGYALGSVRNSLGFTVSPDVVVRKRGPKRQPGGILLRSVLCIAASRVWVHSHISSPTPHSMILWIVVSSFPHSVQSCVSTNRILGSLVFVGIKSCSTIYHADLAPSVAGMLCRLFHILSLFDSWLVLLYAHLS